MQIFQAIILGIIEGLTEFLPISSTGHLLIAQDLMGYKDSAEVFAIVVQMGALGAVLWYYKNNLTALIKGFFAKDKEVVNFWKLWILATIPACIGGVVIVKLFNVRPSPLIIAIALIIGGVIIWLIETYHKTKPPKSKPQLHKLTTRQALSVGLYQVLALVPGVSRSGATIMGGMLSGLDRVTATTFSFYLSIPILLIAGMYKLIDGFGNLSTVGGGGLALIAGTIASFFTSFIVIGWLLKYVSKNNFKIFAYYRIVLGVIILYALVI